MSYIDKSREEKDEMLRDWLRNRGQTSNKIKPTFIEAFQDEDKKYLSKFFNEFNKDNAIPYKPTVFKTEIKPNFLNIFSSSRDCWFQDLFVNGGEKGPSPKYYHLFLGVNTRYAVSYPIDDRETETILHNLKDFINHYHPMKITSDSEPAFRAQTVLDELEDHHIQSKFITAYSDNHSGLGEIDRLCKTLREMYRKKTRLRNGQIIEIEKRIFIPRKDMPSLIDEYNKTPHCRLNRKTPDYMIHNPKAEEEYIMKMIELKDNIENREGFTLEKGSTVRVFTPSKKTPYTKGHKDFSSGLYKVLEQKRGKVKIGTVTPEGKDKELKWLSRAYLLPTKKTQHNAWGTGWEDEDTGVTPIPHTAAVYINKPEKVIKPQIKQMVTRSQAKQEIKPEIKQMVTRTKAGELNRISYDYNKHNKPKGKINKRGRGRK